MKQISTIATVIGAFCFVGQILFCESKPPNFDYNVWGIYNVSRWTQDGRPSWPKEANRTRVDIFEHKKTDSGEYARGYFYVGFGKGRGHADAWLWYNSTADSWTGWYTIKKQAEDLDDQRFQWEQKTTIFQYLKNVEWNKEANNLTLEAEKSVNNATVKYQMVLQRLH